ncbi:MAG: MFS transporter [Clostridiaceae bacterium]|jgi:oligogalacturonide transporter|nr:MFS transporter [Clostridiaceae bacterium]
MISDNEKNLPEESTVAAAATPTDTAATDGTSSDGTASEGIEYDVKLSRKERFLFSLGDFNAGSVGLVVAVYIAFLAANGVSAALAGIVIMVGKIWGAVTDPLIGTLSDNHRGKYGRRRPFIVVGGIMIFFTFVALFLPLYALNSIGFKVFIYLTGYLMFSTVISLVGVPYQAMSVEITANHSERNKINTLRTIISFLSSLLSAGIPILLTESLNDGNISVGTFSAVMIFAFGLLYAAPTIISATYGKERLPVPKQKNKFSFKEFLKPLKQKSFLRLVIIYVFVLTCADVVGANIIYMADFGLNTDFSAFYILAVMMVAFAAMIPIHGKLMEKKSKAALFRLGIPFYVGGVVLLCFFPPALPDYLLFAVAVIIGIGLSGCQLMPSFMFPDIKDLCELKTGEQNAGVYSGVMTFIQKIITAVAIGLSGIILEATGFISPETDAAGIVEKAIQPASAVLGLRLVVMIPIVVLITVAFFVSLGIKISPERSNLVTKLLKLKREDKLDALTIEEAAEYEKIKDECF